MSKPLQRILYAEDEPDIQEIAVLTLESIGGYSLKVCNTGQEALDAALSFQPDLLLLDVMMPEMDGPTALAEIRKLPGMASIPTVFMTAKIQPQEIKEYKVMGALEIIAKPFDPMTLSDTIQNIWNQHTAS